MKKLTLTAVPALLIVVIGAVVLSGNGEQNSQVSLQQNIESAETSELSQETAVPSSGEVLRHIATDQQPYTDMKQYLPADQYDEFFIANMIHFSEGIEQLEELAASSTNSMLSNGAMERSSSAKAEVAFYKQFQKDKGYPISYGDNMVYHGAMGADSAVYFAVTSLEGLEGDAFEDELLAQVIEFRKNQSTIAAVGLDLTSDKDIQEKLDEILTENNALLDVLVEEI
jgi:hypothetical protein